MILRQNSIIKFCCMVLVLSYLSGCWRYGVCVTETNSPKGVNTKEANIVTPKSSVNENPKEAKNVILFIGDGMSLPQIQTAVYMKYGAVLKENGETAKLSFENFPAYGYMTNFAANSLITDSAAAGTALACGKKTNNHVLGQSGDGIKYDSIAELAKKSGKRVGVMSSVDVSNATPASFYSHVKSRKENDEIIKQFFESKLIDVLIGGGLNNKDFKTDDIKAKAKETGYEYFDLNNYEQFKNENLGDKKVFAWFDENDNKMLDFESDRDEKCKEPHLSELTIKALETLKSGKNGFFLMCESGAIDWSGHENKVEKNVGEVLELDKTVAMTIEFLKKEKMLDNTLIIVTADHETGGMTITGPYDKLLSDENKLEVSWTSKNHTALPVMVWATGPGSMLISGKHDDTYVFDLIKSTLTK